MYNSNMEEMIHEFMGIFGFILWPISGVFMIYSLGAWILHGQWQMFLISVGIFGFVTIVTVVLALYAE